MRLLIIAALAVALGPVIAAAQWGLGGCGPVGPVVFAQEPAAYRWYTLPDHPGRCYLFHGKQQVGEYDHVHHVYRPLLDYQKEVWGGVCEPPIPPPLFGVQASKVGTGPAYAIDGKPVTRAEAIQAAAEGIPDDKDKLRATVIAKGDQGKKVADDVKKELGPAAKDFIVRAYPPDHFALKAQGFKTDADGVYVQAPDGKVLHRQDDLDGGAPAVAESLLRAKKDYDLKRDPDLRKLLPSLPQLDAQKLFTLALLGLVAVLAFKAIQAHKENR